MAGNNLEYRRGQYVAVINANMASIVAPRGEIIRKCEEKSIMNDGKCCESEICARWYCVACDNFYLECLCLVDARRQPRAAGVVHLVMR